MPGKIRLTSNGIISSCEQCA